MSWVLVRLCESLDEFVVSLDLGASDVRLMVLQTARGPINGETRTAYPVVRCVLTAAVDADPPILLRYVETRDLGRTEGAMPAGRDFARTVIERGCRPTTGEWRLEDVAEAFGGADSSDECSTAAGA
jgi:hypothetical protein